MFLSLSVLFPVQTGSVGRTEFNSRITFSLSTTQCFLKKVCNGLCGTFPLVWWACQRRYPISSDLCTNFLTSHEMFSVVQTEEPLIYLHKHEEQSRETDSWVQSSKITVSHHAFLQPVSSGRVKQAAVASRPRPSAAPQRTKPSLEETFGGRQTEMDGGERQKSIQRR